MLSATAQVALIVVLGFVAMMLIAAKTKRGLEVSKGRFVFWPPERGPDPPKFPVSEPLDN